MRSSHTASRGGRTVAYAVLALALVAAVLQGGAVSAQQAPSRAEAAKPRTGASGLPLPRFVSVKTDPVNLRRGPGTDYPTTWVFRRAGLPLEVIQEYEGWRQVRDADGADGWVLATLLSNRRTALIAPWDAKPQPGRASRPLVAIRRSTSSTSATVASVESGVLANVRNCDGRWCEISVNEFAGYIEQNKLWGVYPSEVLR